MCWKRSVQVLLLGSGLSMFGVGCAVVDAVVNSPAGTTSKPASPQRMAAIGRIFENQGHLAQAQMMYRKVLQAEPGNLVARDRMEHIAALKSERSFDALARSTRPAITEADVVQLPARLSPPEALTPDTAERLIVTATDEFVEIVPVVSASSSDHDSVIESLPAAAAVTENNVTTESEDFLSAADTVAASTRIDREVVAATDESDEIIPVVSASSSDHDSVIESLPTAAAVTENNVTDASEDFMPADDTVAASIRIDSEVVAATDESDEIIPVVSASSSDHDSVIESLPAAAAVTENNVTDASEDFLPAADTVAATTGIDSEVVAATDESDEIIPVVSASSSDHDSVIESLSTAATVTEHNVTTESEDFLPAADTVAATTGIDSEVSAARRLNFAPGADLQGVALYATSEPPGENVTIGYDGQAPAFVSLAAGWTLADRAVKFEQVARWMEEPWSYSDELFAALQYGENDGVKALAAVLLTDASPDDKKINQALEHAAAVGSDLLKVTALDALVQRSAVTNEGIDDLLAFLTNGNSDIRSHAASSLRNCADSEWATRCVVGLGELLTDEDASVVAMAASTLGDFGSHAAPVCGDLQRLAVEQTDPYLLEAVSVTLQRILNGDSEGTAVTLPPIEEATPDLNESEFSPKVE